MKLYNESESFTLYNGDMSELHTVLGSETVDCIVTDPPYELNFMNKGWDNAGISFQVETWKKCFNVLKPRRLFTCIWWVENLSQNSLCNRRCRL